MRIESTPELKDGFFNFLPEQITEISADMNLELDYAWDYFIDPIITPTIINEWKFLDSLVSKHVTRGAEIVVSVGGRGNSKTLQNLTAESKLLIIVNPGVWDLTNYPDSLFNIEVIKIRGFAESLPLDENCVDAIEIPSTLDHMFDPTKAITETYRVLKIGGKIGITLGNNESWYRTIVQALHLPFRDNHKHAHSFHFSPQQVEELLVKVGYVNVVTIGTAYLKLPKVIERKIKNSRLLGLHSLISNSALSKIFPANRGGMFLTVGEKPFKLETKKNGKILDS
jgi:SAM-dependent methyltransferase